MKSGHFDSLNFTLTSAFLSSAQSPWNVDFPQFFFADTSKTFVHSWHSHTDAELDCNRIFAISEIQIRCLSVFELGR